MAEDAVIQESTIGSTEWSPPLGRAVMASLIGGLIAFAIIQLLYPFIEMKLLPEMGLNPTDEEEAAFLASHTDFFSYNYAIGLGIVGVCLGGLFAALTVPKKQVPSAILAALLAGVGAAIAGYLAGQVTGLELAWSKDQILTKQAGISFGIWACIAVGTAAGAAIIQGSSGTLVKGIVAGVIAAVLVVLANTIAFSIAFPSVNLSNHIPESLVERAVWLVVASLTFGAAMGMGLKSSKPQAAPADSELSAD